MLTISNKNVNNKLFRNTLKKLRTNRTSIINTIKIEEYEKENTFRILIEYCVRYSYNKSFFYLYDKKNDFFDSSYYLEKLLHISLKYKNKQIFTHFIQKFNLKDVIDNISYIDSNFYNIYKTQIKTKNEAIIFLYSILEDNDTKKDFIFYDIIDKFGLNNYYKENGILQLICKNNKINFLEYIHHKNLINCEVDFNKFIYDVIKNNNIEIFNFFYHNNLLNINYRFEAITYNIFQFDRIEILKIIEKDLNNSNKHKNTRLINCLLFGAKDCFNHIIQESKLFFYDKYKHFSYFKILQNCITFQKNIDIFDSKKYISNKIYIFKEILKKFEDKFEILDFYHLLLESFFNIENNLSKTEITLEENLKLSLLNTFIQFISKKDSTQYQNFINYIYFFNLDKGNINIIKYLNSKNIKLLNIFEFDLEEDLYFSFNNFLIYSENLNIEDFKFLINLFKIDLSYNDNILLRSILNKKEKYSQSISDFELIVNEFLNNSNVIKQFSNDILIDIKIHSEIKEMFNKKKKLINF
jgi:hypothetical protein